MGALRTVFAIIIIVVAIFIGLVIVANVYVDNKVKDEGIQVINTPSTVNLSDIEGNVTEVKALPNGTYQITVSSSKEIKYKDNVIAAIKKEAGQFSNVCSVQITTKDDNESRVVYEKPNSVACKFVQPPKEIPPPIVNETKPPVVVPPNETKPPVVTPPVVVPPTPPAPEAETIKVIMVGDVEDDPAGTAVFNEIKKRNADNVIILGDLGYASSLSWFKSTYGTLGNKLNCVIGNHEAANEDGSSSIEKEAKEYCTDSYYFKKNGVLFMGFNTNGNLNVQLGAAQKLVMNKDFMTGIKSVHVMTHKPCATPPNSHHPTSEDPEVKTFCDSLKGKVPAGVKVFFDGAHNHVMAQTADGQYKQSGAGGKSHYTCGTSSTWTFCDNSHFGFLEYTIKADGTTTHQFIDANGGIVK